ncbi:hypothetical protein INT43_006080 [Umbelopsis isabellina]|uniref:Major facilitator superfamily (MFS) profile domain-containing protein n=1 Tax=Mortierella isabellina TaxID=91625 RepID=A0A8H7PJJ2_MORIS|nr:hypothetical protein INT43_006080 [Umbelopsis isabellina]
MDKGQSDGFVTPQSPNIPSGDKEKIRSSLCSLETANAPMMKDYSSQISNDYSMEDAIIDGSGFHKEIAKKYSAYSSWRKWCIGAIVSLAQSISPVSGLSFLLALNPMRESLQVSMTEMKLAMTLYMVVQSVTPSFWGPIADGYGRRPAFGATALPAVGSGVIGDIATPSKRGGYIGVFNFGATCATIFAPLIAGAISQVFGWRWIFGILGIISASVWLIILLFLNETLRTLVGNGSAYANSFPLQRLCLPKKSKIEPLSSEASNSKSKIAATSILFASFQNLREKDAILPLLYYAIHFASLCCFTTSIPELYLRVYSMNSVQIGLVYVVHGVGSAIGNILGGKLLNYDFQATAKKQGMSASSSFRGNLDPSFPIEYARLRCIWIHVILLAAAVGAHGWCIQKQASLFAVLPLDFIIGFASTTNYAAVQNLLLDIFPGRQASIMASNNLTRCLFGAAATQATTPLITFLGVGPMFTIIAGLELLSLAIFIPVLKWGPQWRKQRLERTENLSKTVKS